MVKQLIVGLLQTNCYLYSQQQNGTCVIIDPGADDGTIIHQIETLRLKPIGIALTHGHFDHTSAVGKLKAYYQKAGLKLGIAVHRKDAKYFGLKGEAENRKDLEYLGLYYSEEMFKTFFSPLPDEDIRIKEGDTVFNTDLAVLETPGHTQGGVCYYSARNHIIFSGDTLFCEGIGRSDIAGGNVNLLIRSIKARLLNLPAETKVYPGHGPVTTIGHELKHNPFIRGGGGL
ncbi:MAG TPA: MBL fold metallo-hydrolase [Spirochaetia bacterium]|nr:MBL fold metallo-hydrolase [Spirochaetia bacterium]